MWKWIVGLSFMISLTAGALPPGVGVAPSGELELNGLQGRIIVYANKWRSCAQSAGTVTAHASYPVSTEKLYELWAEFAIPDTPGFTLHQWVREKDSSSVISEMILTSQEGVRCNLAVFALRLPAGVFENREIRIDGESARIATLERRGVSAVSFVHAGKRMTFRGENITLQISDARKYNGGYYYLRFFFSPASGLIVNASLKLEITQTPLMMSLLDFSPVPGSLSQPETIRLLTRLGVADYQERPREDGPSLPPKRRGPFRVAFGGIEFMLGRAMLQLGSGETAEMKPVSGAGSRLYLLHSTGEGAAPYLLVRRRNGDTQRISLKKEVDYTGKKPAPRRPNAVCVASNDRSFENLQLSGFDLGGAAIESLTFGNAGQGVFRVAAATRTDTLVPLSSLESIFYQTANENYVPFEQFRPARPGTALDFSFLLDAPAGKYGRIIAAPDGHFTAEKAPEKRFRFYGPNLCKTAAFPDHATADKLAEELAMLGFNAIRIHHYDHYLGRGSKNDSTVLSPEYLDRFDYLFSRLKERGIYVTLDLYCNRKLYPGELGHPGTLKELLPVWAPARENYKKFVRNLLTHTNPYTKTRYADEPALYFVSLVNESVTYTRYRGKDAAPLYEAAYADYLRRQKIDTPENRRSRGELFFRFLLDLEHRLNRELIDFLRNEIGFRGMITEGNYMNNLAMAPIRDSVDLADVHQYWDHPFFLPGNRGRMPLLHNHTSVLNYDMWNPRTIMPMRIFGKPFSVSEVNWCFPNRRRAESGVIFGAYASLQDWDSINRFTWHHWEDGVKHERPIHGFNIAQDAISQFSDRIAVLLFLRRNIRPAEKAVAMEFGDHTFDGIRSLNETETHVDFERLGFIHRIGSISGRREFPGLRRIRSHRDMTPAEKSLSAQPVRRSDTGELIYDSARGELTVVSPESECLIFRNGSASGKVLSVSGAVSDQQVVAVAAMDRRPLASGRKLLLFHLTDVTNLHIRYSSENCKAVEEWGRNLQLVLRRKAAVSLKIAPGGYRVEALRMDGTPKLKLPSVYRDGALRFTVDTGLAGGTLAYVITKEADK